MTTNNTQVNDRELDTTKSLEKIDSDINRLEQSKTILVKKKDNLTKYLNLVNESGYGSSSKFLIELEIIPNPSVKRPRTVISDLVRQNIISDLKLGTMTSKELSEKHGVPVSSIDNIKGENGLTKPRQRKVPTPSVSVPTPMETVTPSNVTPMVQSPELLKEVV